MRSCIKDWTTKEALGAIEGWARRGLTMEQIAKNMGCSRSTLQKWKATNSSIADALKKGKEVSALIVENALFKSAIGYRATETITEETIHPNGTSTLHTKTTEKHIAPNVGAAIFYLKNRVKDRWRDNPDMTDEDFKPVELIVERGVQKIDES